MVVGKGMLAKAFKKYEGSDSIVIFASGVSNSKEINSAAYQRERDLVIDTINENKNKVFVYFSTCSIEDESQSRSLYVKHKLDIESIITSSCAQYYIFRLPQVVGETNSPTIINFLIKSIQLNKKVEVYKNASRNLIDVDDVFYICNDLIKQKKHMREIINIASPYNIKVTEIISILERLTNKKAITELVDKGQQQTINIEKISSFLNLFETDYVEKILKKRVMSL